MAITVMNAVVVERPDGVRAALFPRTPFSDSIVVGIAAALFLWLCRPIGWSVLQLWITQRALLLDNDAKNRLGYVGSLSCAALIVFGSRVGSSLVFDPWQQAKPISSNPSTTRAIAALSQS
jgi:hypothetical protein